MISSYLLTPAALRPTALPVTAPDKRPVIDEKKHRYTAPNGNPLRRVNIKLPNADSSSQYALVDAKTHQFYFVRAMKGGQVGVVEGPAPVPQKPGLTADRLQKAISAQVLAGGLPVTGADQQPTIVKGQPFLAPDGTELLRVGIKLPNADSKTQYALVNPKTLQFYFVRAQADDYQVGLVSGPAPLAL